MKPIYKTLTKILVGFIVLVLLVAGALFVFGDEIAAWYLKGKSPENTLHLFVQAMGAQNYDIAESYIAAESRDNYANMFAEARAVGQQPVFIDAYINGRVAPAEQIGEGNLYVIAVYPPDSEEPFRVELYYDESAREWKILSL